MPKVLVVDNELSCEILQKQLSQCGYDVIVALEGGEQGILFAVTKSPDLILIGADLPVINGWQSINILKASTVTCDIPIIALISPTQQNEWQMALESGCDDYCLKPVALNHLLGKADRLLGHTLVPSTPMDTGDTGKTEAAPYLQRIPEQPLSRSKNTQKQESLPLEQTVNSPTSESKTALPNAPMVVYVEDNAADSQIMAEIIETAGYRYKNIADSLHTLPQLLEFKPQLIFLDLVMPVANGYELCAQIRRISAFKETPIVIVTNNNSIADRVRAKIVGASGFLGKPIKEKRVLKVLNRYLHPSHDYRTEADHQQLVLGHLY
ncbi:MAG: response regulator [Cyanobacteria bacterium P01_D01_bin.156]